MLSRRTRIILLIILFTSCFLLNTNRTDADLVAERVVRNNRLTATTLSFSQRHTANDSHLSLLFNTVGLLPGGFDLAAVRLKKEGKLNFKYQLKVNKTGGDDLFCQALKIQVMQQGSFKFEGSLLDLVIQANINEENLQHDWIFFISLEDNNANLRGKNCQFDFYFKTFRTNPQERKGFYAERTLTNNILSGFW